MSVPNHNLHHKGRLHSADGSFYEVRLYVHIDASSGPAASTWPLRNLTIDTGGRGASENKCLYEGQANVEFLCDDAGAFAEASQAAEGQAVMDIVRASSKADFGTTAEEVIWKGYLLSDFYSRSLKGKQQSVKVTGKTGLNRLEEMPFDPVSDVPDLVEQDGRMRYIDAVAYCLGKLREDMDISSASALYATREDGSAMAETAPLSQIKIDAARLYPSEKRIFNFGTGVSGAGHVNLGAGALSSGSATDCKTALQILLGDEHGEAGLRKLFPSRLNGRAAWLIVERPLEELSAGYQRYRYTLGSTGGAVYQDQELFDPAVTEGEEVTTFRSDSNPAKQYRNSLHQAAVEYAHLAVPNLLRYGPLEIWNSSDNSPYGWTAHNAAADFSAKVIYHQDAPYDQNTPEEVGQTGLAMQAYARSGRTDPEPYSRALNEAHWHHDSAEYKAGDLVKISARLYARILPEFEDRTGNAPFSVPFGVELHADDGTTYYLSRRRYPNDTYKTASWETDPQLAGTPVFAVEGDQHDEDSITAPALPADGFLRFRLLRTFTTDVLEEVAWGDVDLSLVDGQGEVLEGVVHTAAVPDVEGELRNEAVAGFGDGPAQSQGALLVQNASGTWGPSEFWRFGFSSSPPENGGAGIPLAQYHARTLALQRARPRHERTGTMTWGMKPHVVPAFENVFVTDEGRLAPVSTRWHVAAGELDGRWVEVSTLTEDGTAPSVTEGSRVQASASSLPSANVVTRLGERVSRVQEEERDRQRLTRLSADVPAGSVASLPVEPLAEASEMLRAGRKVLVIGSYGESWTFEIATTYQAGEATLDVVDKTIEGRILAGAYVLPGAGEALSVITQHADEIRNTLIAKGDVVTELTLDLQGMLFQGDRFATTTFDGTYGTDAQGHTTITDPGTTGAAITESGDAAFEGIYAREFVTEGTADDKYLLVSGDTMEGDLTFGDGTTNHALLRGENSALNVYASDGTNKGEVVADTVTTNQLNVLGDINQTNVQDLQVENQYIAVNSGQTGTPNLNGGLRAERGDVSDAFMLFEEGLDRWGSKIASAGTFKPFALNDATLQQDLNADLWHGWARTDYLDQDVRTSARPAFSGASLTADLDLQAAGEVYDPSASSSINQYVPSGTLMRVRTEPGSVNKGALIDFTTHNSSGSATGAYIGAAAGVSGNGPASLVFGRRTGTTVWEESARIDPQGRLGLGTTSPAAKAHLHESALDTPTLHVGRYDAEQTALFEVGEHHAAGGSAGSYGGALLHSQNRAIGLSTQNEAAFTNVTRIDLLIDLQGNTTLSGDVLLDGGDGIMVQTDHWVDKRSGFGLSYGGRIDAREMYVDELIAKAFTVDLTQALAGSDFLTKSVATLASAFIAPAASSADGTVDGGTGTLTVNDLPGQKGVNAFADGDWIRLRVMERDAGLTILDVWGVVNYPTAGDPASPDNGDDTQSWTFQRADASTYATGKMIHKEAPALDYGQSGQGVIRRTVEGGTYGAVETWTGNPVDGANYNQHHWYGDLSKIAAANTTGWGLYTDKARLEDDILIGSLDKTGEYVEVASGAVSLTGSIHHTGTAFDLNSDGSGQLAGGKIAWDTNGNITANDIFANNATIKSTLTVGDGTTNGTIKSNNYSAGTAGFRFDGNAGSAELRSGNIGGFSLTERRIQTTDRRIDIDSLRPAVSVRSKSGYDSSGSWLQIGNIYDVASDKTTGDYGADFSYAGISYLRMTQSERYIAGIDFDSVGMWAAVDTTGDGTPDSFAGMMDASQDYYLFAGANKAHPTASDATTFNVTHAGQLTARGVYVKGEIHATSGTFTGTLSGASGDFTGTVTATNGRFYDSVTIDNGVQIGGASGWTVSSPALVSSNAAMTMNGETGIITIEDPANAGEILSIGPIGFNDSQPKTINYSQPSTSAGCQSSANDLGGGVTSDSDSDPSDGTFRTDVTSVSIPGAGDYEIEYSFDIVESTSTSGSGTASASGTAEVTVDIRDSTGTILATQTQTRTASGQGSGKITVSTTNTDASTIRIATKAKTSTSASVGDGLQDGDGDSAEANASANASTGLLQKLGATNEFISSKGALWNPGTGVATRVGIRRSDSALLVGDWRIYQLSGGDLRFHNEATGATQTYAA